MYTLLAFAVVLARMTASFPAARLVPESPDTFFSVNALVPPSLTTIAAVPLGSPRVTVFDAAVRVMPM